MTDEIFVDKIGPDDTGIYLVTTQGSEHTWNLDEGFYVREPQDHGSHASMVAFRNGHPHHWIKVERWPEVGVTFLVFLHGDIPWHRSSTVKTIQKIA